MRFAAAAGNMHDKKHLAWALVLMKSDIRAHFGDSHAEMVSHVISSGSSHNTGRSHSTQKIGCGSFSGGTLYFAGRKQVTIEKEVHSSLRAHVQHDNEQHAGDQATTVSARATFPNLMKRCRCGGNNGSSLLALRSLRANTQSGRTLTVIEASSEAL